MLAVILALLVLLIGLALFYLSQRLHARTGLPSGRVVYSDTGTRRNLDKPLLSRRYGLVGKPDYLVEVQRRLPARRHLLTIPVEVKSRLRPPQPHDSHILQLATYCLLVEDQLGVRPPYGLLRYADATLEIPFTDALRGRVLQAADDIRQAREAQNVHRHHEDVGRCRGCGYREACGEEALI